jgi:hypothetical protein
MFVVANFETSSYMVLANTLLNLHVQLPQHHCQTVDYCLSHFRYPKNYYPLNQTFWFLYERLRTHHRFNTSCRQERHDQRLLLVTQDSAYSSVLRANEKLQSHKRPRPAMHRFNTQMLTGGSVASMPLVVTHRTMLHYIGKAANCTTTPTLHHPSNRNGIKKTANFKTIRDQLNTLIRQHTLLFYITFPPTYSGSVQNIM